MRMTLAIAISLVSIPNANKTTTCLSRDTAVRLRTEATAERTSAYLAVLQMVPASSHWMTKYCNASSCIVKSPKGNQKTDIVIDETVYTHKRERWNTWHYSLSISVSLGSIPGRRPAPGGGQRLKATLGKELWRCAIYGHRSCPAWKGWMHFIILFLSIPQKADRQWGTSVLFFFFWDSSDWRSFYR